MTTTLTVDYFMSLDGYGSAEGWPGYWGKEGPQLRQDRVDTFERDQVLVLGATTFREFAKFVKLFDEPYYDRLNEMPKLVFSSTLDPQDPGWENSTVLAEDAVAAIRRLKETTDVPLRSHGSISLNRALLAAGVVDRLEVMVFPAITGKAGYAALFQDGAEFDLDLVDTTVLDGRTLKLVYEPILHTAVADGVGPKRRTTE
ncbi:dihydrofolate reductase family protein [Agromyces sp. SYSU K20354]|uniref:dihydrofolate reductase family protein n=1 Tax=Agromyces cavernae TaxID=2898659 RepID=UPI001E5BC6E9|nr:dihydrofolate reductase family protein [Agromyces cavernae]MCD2442821.1 dihydrofolate reductase family protein [Agromyces cavernae]